MGIDDTIRKAEEYLKVDKALNSTTVSAFWIKDKNFRFLRYNQAMINLLYPNANKDDLLGKTDWEYVSDIGYDKDVVDKVKNCCTLSDELILKSNLTSAKFFEKCRVIGSNNYIWLFTTKSRIPPTADKKSCLGVYGTATIFNSAEKIIDSGILKVEKLSETCYRLVE